MGTGYTRQSLADIQPGQDIAAGPINAELNQIQSAFNATTGHAHDGSLGNGPKINLTTSVTGILPVANGGSGGTSLVSSASDPGVDDDSDDGYVVGTIWTNTTTNRSFIAADVTVGAAVWLKIVRELSNAILPEVDATTDLGSGSLQYKDGYFSGTVTVPTVTVTTGNITTLNVTTIGAHAVSGAVDMQSNRINNLPTPSATDEPATKGYADGLAFSSALPGISPSTNGQYVTNDGSVSFWSSIPDAEAVAIFLDEVN